jgi:hypothetical protein
MKFPFISATLAAFLLGATAQAMDAPQARNTLAADIQLAAESHEQKCSRWADLEGVKGDEHAEYVKYCMIDLSVPDKSDGDGDD